MFFISDAFAQTASTGGDMAGFLGSLLPLILIFAVFWFFLIRPQQKQQKERVKMMSELAKGDEILTIGGIVGRIVDLGEEYLVVQIATVKDERVTLMMPRTAVQKALPKNTIKSF
ncbi:MAG TPA: preprotein translocase subunit YajC [Candidatus Aphodousia gallistercoris]|nr:preprotein translocase subunit YajC [Candidatus Aphodousia gallistercoris]